MNERSDKHYADAEVISIIEGPTPAFQAPNETWAISIQDSFQPQPVTYCQMRTLNGPQLLERCQNAWAEDRPVKLDFPDELGLRRQVDVVAARWSETHEGHLFHLWVRMLPPAELEQPGED